MFATDRRLFQTFIAVVMDIVLMTPQSVMKDVTVLKTTHVTPEPVNVSTKTNVPCLPCVAKMNFIPIVTVTAMKRIVKVVHVHVVDGHEMDKVMV
jgi:hypothetical protein